MGECAFIYFMIICKSVATLGLNMLILLLSNYKNTLFIHVVCKAE